MQVGPPSVDDFLENWAAVDDNLTTHQETTDEEIISSIHVEEEDQPEPASNQEPASTQEPTKQSINWELAITSLENLIKVEEQLGNHLGVLQFRSKLQDYKKLQSASKKQLKMTDIFKKS